MMNSIIDAALRYNRAVLLTLILLLGAGSLTYVQLPKEATPDIKLPFLYVSASLKGISPDDSLDQLLEPLEQEIQGLEGLKSFDSTAFQGGANLTLEFEAGWDVDRAKDDVQEAVDNAQQNLPSEADDPSVVEITISEANLVLNISGQLPERELNRIADELQDAIEEVDTVLEVELTGNRDEVVEILIDPQTLISFGIDINSLLAIINGQNTLVSAGQLEGDSGSFPIELPGTFETIDDILSTPVITEGTAAVTLGDIAQIRRTFTDAESFARINGAPTLSLAVNKRSGENLIATVDRVKTVVDENLDTLDSSISDRVQVTYSYDESTSVRQLLGDLVNNTAFAILLVLVVVLAVLGLRSALLVAVAIPGSFMIGFLVLAGMGLSLNIVVLFSLILASGMLVDGAVVVTEYADRRLAEGYTPNEAYGMAAKQMSWPIIASTATTLAAFGPMIFFPGIIGEFMKFLPITLFVTLSASLFMALLFVPTLGANLNRFVRTTFLIFGIPMAFGIVSLAMTTFSDFRIFDFLAAQGAVQAEKASYAAEQGELLFGTLSFDQLNDAQQKAAIDAFTGDFDFSFNGQTMAEITAQSATGSIVLLVLFLVLVLVAVIAVGRFLLGSPKSGLTKKVLAGLLIAASLPASFFVSSFTTQATTGFSIFEYRQAQTALSDAKIEAAATAWNAGEISARDLPLGRSQSKLILDGIPEDLADTATDYGDLLVEVTDPSAQDIQGYIEANAEIFSGFVGPVIDKESGDNQSEIVEANQELLPIFGVATVVLGLLMMFVAPPLIIFLVGTPKVLMSPEEAMDIRTITGPAGAYASLLRQLLRAPIFMIVLTFCVLASLLMLYMAKDRGSEFFPEVEAEFANLIIHSRGDFSLEENDALVAEVESRVLAVQERNSEFYSAQADSNSTSTNGSDTIGTINLVFTDWFLRDRRVPEIMAELREVASDIPGIQVEIQTVSGGPPTGKAMQLELSSNNGAVLDAEVSRILAYMKSLPELTDVEDSRPAPGTKFVIDVDREAATRVGVDLNLIGSYVRLITTGIDITTYRPVDSDDELDIKLRLPNEYRNLTQLNRIRVETPVGQVPLSSLVTVRAEPRTSIIAKKDGDRALNIQANITEGSDTNATLMIKQVTEWLEENPTSDEVEWKFGGEQQDQAEAMTFLGQAMGAAVFIMFLILLVQFNSFYQTLLILTAVVMSVFGVFLGLVITDKPFGVFTFIGVVSLAGIVVNNNIVLIDTYNTLRRKLMPNTREEYMEVIMLTGAQRLRPVMITTVTTILGLLPMAMGIGVDFTNWNITIDAPSAQWWTGLAQAIAFGLTVATMLTLFFTPSALMFRDLFRAEGGFFGRGKSKAQDGAADAGNNQTDGAVPA